MCGAATGTGRPRPLKRAVRQDGLFPADGTPDELGPMLDVIAAELGTLDGFDVALPLSRPRHRGVREGRRGLGAMALLSARSRWQAG